MFIQLFMHGTSCISIMQAISCIYTLMQNWYILSNVPWRIKSTCSTSSLDCWMIMQCCVVWFQTQAPHWRFDGSVSWLGVHELLLELAAVGSAEYLCLNGCFCEWRTIHSILTIVEVEWYLWFKQLYANPKSSVCFDIHCYTLESLPKNKKNHYYMYDGTLWLKHCSKGTNLQKIAPQWHTAIVLNEVWPSLTLVLEKLEEIKTACSYYNWFKCAHSDLAWFILYQTILP